MTYPAGYTNGPLGANNVLPSAPAGALLGVYSGFSGATDADVENRISYLQQQAGRHVDVVGVHFGGGGTYGGQTQCAYPDTPLISWAHSNGSVAVVSWEPNRSTGNGDSELKQINDGLRDSCIGAVADLLKGFGYRVMLRPFVEFDFGTYHKRADGSYDYSTDGGTSVDSQLGGEAVASAFQRVVSIFQAHGATNVGFVWCPDEGGDRAMQDYAWPGDSNVDWVSSDRYNRNSGWSSPQGSGWAEFNDLFNYPPSVAPSIYYRFALGHSKPFFVSETSTRYDSTDMNRKGNWFIHVGQTKDPADPKYMENLIGVDVFDQYVTAENNSDWRIDSNQTADMQAADTLGSFSQESLNGWISWARDPRWNVGVLGGAG